MARQSKDAQYRYFSAGLALGLLKYEHYDFPQEKTALEFALAQAIREWEHNQEFPAVLGIANDDEPGPDMYLIMQMRDQDKTTPRVPFYWDRYSELPAIRASERASFDPSSREELEAVASNIKVENGISYDAWANLAGAFLRNLDDDQ